MTGIHAEHTHVAVQQPAVEATVPGPARRDLLATPHAAPAPAGQGNSPLQGLSLADASMALGSGHNLVATYVVGANNQLAQIRLTDPITHQVVAESPPDSIARMQQEMLAYQDVARKAAASSEL